jgi:hypothetical protein
MINNEKENLGFTPLSKNLKKVNHFYAKKPSDEWRKGDETLYTENENLKNLKLNCYSPGKLSLILDSKNDYEKTIYPKWWGAEKNLKNMNEEQHSHSLNPPYNRTQNYNSNQYKRHNNKNDNQRYKTEHFSNSRNNSRKAYSPAVTEVYINKSVSKPKTKRQKLKSDKKAKLKHKNSSQSKLLRRNNYLYSEWGNNDDFNLNIKNAESKIKSQVIYDRLMYKSSKSQREIINSSEEWKFNKNDNTQHSNISQTNTPERSGIKKNYMISYDKSLKPEVIREKSKETVETAKFSPDQDAVENINLQSGVCSNYHDKEYLSSYAPSERTKCK